ncbi:MAG: LytR C-terminal domain-containing protein [Acidimicrobiales bacterium]
MLTETDPSDPGRDSAVDAPGDDPDDETPPPPPARPIRPGRRSALLARWGFPLALVLLAVVTVVLALIGRDAILDSTEGDVVRVVTDPAAPGFRVLVEPTPSALWVLIDDDDALIGLVVAGLADPEGGGGIGVLPARATTSDLDGRTFADLYAEEGLDSLAPTVAATLDIGFGDVAVIDARQWEALFAPVAPLTVSLATDLVAEDGTVVYPAGDVEVAAADVAAVLAWESPGDPAQARVIRQGTILSVYLDALSEVGPDVVPGEGDVGVPLFLRSFARGSHVVLVPETTESDGALVADLDEVRDLAIDLVPFPLPAEPGGRPTVRLLDGVGDQAMTLSIADTLVRAGAQVSVLGNAEEFDVVATTIEYHTEAARQVAEEFRSALGVGTVTFVPLAADSETSFVSVTVTVGSDAGEAG